LFKQVAGPANYGELVGAAAAIRAAAAPELAPNRPIGKWRSSAWMLAQSIAPITRSALFLGREQVEQQGGQPGLLHRAVHGVA
jgi:hypothetical protein